MNEYLFASPFNKSTLQPVLVLPAFIDSIKFAVFVLPRRLLHPEGLTPVLTATNLRHYFLTRYFLRRKVVRKANLLQVFSLLPAEKMAKKSLPQLEERSSGNEDQPCRCSSGQRKVAGMFVYWLLRGFGSQLRHPDGARATGL